MNEGYISLRREVRIRLRFSSIVNYLAIIYRMVIAIGFTIIVARKLGINEFGLWGVLLSLTSMLTTPTTFWSFWIQRYLSRKVKKSFGTGLLLTLIYNCIITPIFIGMGVLLGSIIIKSCLVYVLLSIPYFWLNTLNAYLTRIFMVTKPEAIGFRGFIYETIRLILTFILVAYLKLHLIGAILALELALLVSNTYSLILLKLVGVLETAFSRNLVSEWLKGFTVPLLSIIYNFLVSSVRAFTSIISGSGVSVAYLNVGLSTQTPIISASTAATPALYAKILKGGGSSDIEEVIRISIFVSAMLLALFITLSKTIASIFNPRYVDAWIIIIVLAIYAFLEGLRAIFMTVIMGSVKVDVDGIRSFKELINSGLFYAPLVRVLGLVLSYVVGGLLVIVFWGDYLMQAFGIALGLLVGVLVTMPWFIVNALRSVRFRVPLREVCVAVISGSVVAAYLVFMRVNELVVRSFWVDAPVLAIHLLASLAIYLSVWYALSPWFRGLTRESLRYLHSILHIEIE